MKMTEPYSPTARAKASAKPVSTAGSSAGRIDAEKVCRRVAPRVAAASSTSLLDVLHHRLHRAHDERQADEDQRDEDAERRVGDLDAERRGSWPSQPFGA